MALTQDELMTFTNFASVLIENGRVSCLEECLLLWHEDREFAETIAAIREGLEDSAAGRTQPVEQAFADIRRELALPQRTPV